MFNFLKSKNKPKPTEVTDANFNTEVFNNEMPIVLDFKADWCQPCQVMISLMNRLAKDEDIQNTVKIGMVDIDGNPALAKHFAIRSVPTLLFIYKNKVVERKTGLLPYPVLKEEILKFSQDITT